MEHITFSMIWLILKTMYDSCLLKIDKNSYKTFGIYKIGYITIKKSDGYENICGVNPL